MSLILQNAYVQCAASIADNIVTVYGHVLNMSHYHHVNIIAANPIEQMINYSGSGLPFPCAQVAFENTPNHKLLEGSNGEFKVKFHYPNSYYDPSAKTRIPPSIFFVLYEKDKETPAYVRFELPERPMTTVRSLTHRPLRTGPQFHSLKEEIMPLAGAEETMRNYIELKINQGLA